MLHYRDNYSRHLLKNSKTVYSRRKIAMGVKEATTNRYLVGREMGLNSVYNPQVGINTKEQSGGSKDGKFLKENIRD